MQTTIKALPDTILIDPEKDSSQPSDKPQVTLGNEKKGRILKGTVLDIGDPIPSAMNVKYSPPLKVGDTVYYLSYEGDYDNIVESDGTQLYFVLFKDLRGYKRNESLNKKGQFIKTAEKMDAVL